MPKKKTPPETPKVEAQRWPELATADTRDRRTTRRDEFVKQVLAVRNKPVVEHKPAALSPRMTEQTRLEMEEGARRVQAADEIKRNRPAPRRGAGEGSSVPVYRPKDYVPNMKQGNVSARPV